MIVHLRPGRYPLTAELHHPYFWTDRYTGKHESYLAGFPDPDAAAKAHVYAASHGWQVAA